MPGRITAYLPCALSLRASRSRDLPGPFTWAIRAGNPKVACGMHVHNELGSIVTACHPARRLHVNSR
jgi:hypothetical protein